MDTMISALGVLVDGVDTRDDTARDLAVRAAALDAAITHLAGDGSKVADSKGDGRAVVRCAETFERYLTGADPDTVAVPTQELRLLAGALADVGALLRAADFHEQDDAEAWAQRRDVAVGVLAGLGGQLDDRAGGR